MLKTPILWLNARKLSNNLYKARSKSVHLWVGYTNKVRQVMQPPKTIIIKDWKHLIHFISKNKQVRIWHQKFGYASNAKVTKALKLLTKIENFNTKYNLTKVYSNFEKFKLEAKKLLSLSPHILKVSSLVGILLAQFYASLLKVLVYTIIDNNFDSFCLSFVASKQTCVII